MLPCVGITGSSATPAHLRHRHLYFGRSQQIIAQRQASAAKTSTAAVETPLGSTVGPYIDATPPPEPTGSQQVVAQPQWIADEASAAQHAPGATMPWVATSDGEPDQTSQNFEIQSNHHATLDGGSVAFTPESRFPETQVKESAGFFWLHRERWGQPTIARCRITRSTRGQSQSR